MRKAWIWFAYDANERIVAKGYFRSGKGRPDVPLALRRVSTGTPVFRHYVATDAPYYVEAYARRAMGYKSVEAAPIGGYLRDWGLK